MFQILENKMLVPNLHQITLLAPEIARAAQPGQFVILRVEEDGERIPLTVSDWDRAKRHYHPGLSEHRAHDPKTGFAGSQGSAAHRGRPVG